MKRHIVITAIATVVMLGGCATKKYVAEQVDPANAKINEVDKNQKNTQRQLEGDEPKISAADEKAHVRGCSSHGCHWAGGCGLQEIGPGAC